MRRVPLLATLLVFGAAASSARAQDTTPAEAPAPGPGSELIPGNPAPMENPPSTGAAQTQAGPRPLAEKDPTYRAVYPVRRNGVMLGAQGGFALAGSSGHPNNARFEDDPNYHSESPMLGGYALSFYLQGALTDWISFGPAFELATFDSKEWKSTGFGIGFRADTYPLLDLVPSLGDLSLYGVAGVGHTSLQAKGNYPGADGTASWFGGGVHYEWRLSRLLGGHAAAGPFAEYIAITSTSAERHTFSIGLRLAWYGGHVKLDD